mgnify:CR=1 FL=1
MQSLRHKAPARYCFPRPFTMVSANAAISWAIRSANRRAKAQVVLSRIPAADINIVKHFHVIAWEADRLHEDSGVTLRFELEDRFLDGRAQPGSARHALALERELPFFGLELPLRGRRVRRSPRALRLVGIAFGDGALRHASALRK